MRKIRSICTLVFAVSFLLFLGSIAFAVPCGFGSVGGAPDCQDGLSNNDFPAPATVNGETFFGYSDWQYLDKYEVGEGYDNGQVYDWTVLGVPGNQGTWSFDSTLWNTFDDAMIVVKIGKIVVEVPLGEDLALAMESVDIFFSGYLLEAEASSGSWATGRKDLSHLSLYARGGKTPPVPEPGTLLLLGLGLVGLAVYRKKCRKI